MSSEECSSWFSSSGLFFVVSPGSINSCGCIVLYLPVLSLVSSSSDSNGRFLLCNFSFHDVPFRVACVYAPNYVPERDNFFSDVASRVDPSVPTVIVGDFNTVFDRAIDRMGSVVAKVQLLLAVFLVMYVVLTFGGISIRLLPASLGQRRMALYPHVLI